jgi:pyruvate dehydrogenase E2 component (dihydrolipoamide acetyltransferase)
MQSTRLLITAQRCSSVSRINYLLKRCLTIPNTTTKANLNNSVQTLVDSYPSSCINGRLLSLSRSSIIPIRYASSGSLPPHKKITLPALSPTMETGTIRSWAKNEGDKIAEGDILAEIETDKATLGFEAGDEGYLAKILIPGGSKDIPVGKLCAILVEKAEDIAAFKDFKDDGKASSAKAKSSSEEQTTSAEKSEKKEKESTKKEDAKIKTDQETISTEKKEQQTSAKTDSSNEGDRVAASPLAKKLAQEKGIELESIQGSGPNGRIVAEDVEKFIKEGGVKVKKGKDTQAAPSKPAKKDKETAARAGGYDEQQISELRAENARRVTESKTTIPHYYLNIQVELDEIVKLRQKFNEMLTPKSKDSKEKSRGITINDFVIKAAALACKKQPETNSVWMDKSIRQYETVDINVAIATDAGVYVTPIVYNADQKGLSAISKEISQLSEKANSGKLTGDELELGTFTISNLGMYGVSNFSAIIYPQQSAILAIGGIETKLVPAADSPKGFRQSTVLNVTLACDHRVIDGAVGAQWLQEFKQFLENPGSMIL